MLKMYTAYELVFPEQGLDACNAETLAFRGADGETLSEGELPLVPSLDKAHALDAVCLVDVEGVLPVSPVQVQIQNVHSPQFQTVFARGGRLAFVYEENALRALIVDAQGCPAFELPIADPFAGATVH